MSKMKDKRRKRRKALKLFKSYAKKTRLEPLKIRIPMPPPTVVFKSDKDYDRKDSKKAIEKLLDE